MARDIQVFDVSVPPGGSATAPQKFALTLPPRRVTGVEFQIPDGNRGSVKFAIGMGGTQLVPSNTGQFISGNAEVIHWPLSGMPDSGAWQMLAFNTGVWAHVIQVRFLLELVSTGQSTGAVLIPSSSLTG